MLRLETLRITPEMVTLIGGIDEFKGRWDTLERYTTSLRLLGDFADVGHDFRGILRAWHRKPFDMESLGKIHTLFQLDPENPGLYREKPFPLIVQDGRHIVGTLETATPEEIEDFTEPLIEWVNENLSDMRFHPLLTIGIFTALFLQISPFERGNQRLARLLIVMLMIRQGYAYAPFASLEKIFARHTPEYYTALKAAQESVEAEKPDFTLWLEFFLRLLRDHKDLLQGRLILATKMIVGLPPLSAKIIELFEIRKTLPMREIAALTGANRSTLKLRLNELVESGHLRRHGKGAGVRYSMI